MNLDFGPYEPCPCGSGKKYKFCCAEKNKDKRHGKFPIGTVAYYGPDDKTVTKIAAGVKFRDNDEPTMQRWIGPTVFGDQKVADEIKQFFAKNGVKNIVISSSIMGCPHEEGIDFPRGQECPFCPFWTGKQGIVVRDAEEEAYEIEDELDDGEPEIDMTDAELEELEEQETREYEAMEQRIRAVLGDGELTSEQARDIWLAHLQKNLTFPFNVTGTEDFRWEEPYVLGNWSISEYERLKNSQPSYQDEYELTSIDGEEISKWMMFGGEDLGAHVRRISDGKTFVLGLAELTASGPRSPNHELLEDFSSWLVNNLR